jgi:type III pantothenate kinase
MMMRFKSLHNYTAKLPLVDPMQFTSFELTGTDTTTSILSGVVNGIKEEVQGIIKQYDSRFGNLAVVATGGDALLFATLLNCEIFARPYLVLEGLNRILNYNTE